MTKCNRISRNSELAQSQNYRDYFFGHCDCFYLKNCCVVFLHYCYIFFFIFVLRVYAKVKLPYWTCFSKWCFSSFCCSSLFSGISGFLSKRLLLCYSRTHRSCASAFASCFYSLLEPIFRSSDLLSSLRFWCMFGQQGHGALAVKYVTASCKDLSNSWHYYRAH